MTAIMKVSETAIVNVEYFSENTIGEFIKSRKCSENTARTYRNACRRLSKFFATKQTAPTTAGLDEFFNQLRSEKKSDATLKLYFAVAKLYFKFLAKNNIYLDVAADAEPLNLRKSQTHKKGALSESQAKKLLAAVKGDDVLARRDRALLALALSTGVRCCEISRASKCDFNVNEEGDGDYLLAVTGKGHQTADATVRVALPVVELINSYLELRGEISNDAPLFVSESNQNRGARLSVQAVGLVIRKYMQACKVYRKHSVSPHSTRHFAARQSLKNGVDIREVSAMLRHTSLNVTMVYLADIAAQTRRAELTIANSLFGVA